MGSRLADPWVIVDRAGGVFYYREIGRTGLCGWFKDLSMAQHFTERRARLGVAELQRRQKCRRKSARRFHFYCAQRAASLTQTGEEKGGHDQSTNTTTTKGNSE